MRLSVIKDSQIKVTISNSPSNDRVNMNKKGKSQERDENKEIEIR
jgi:hypothetical protein